MSAAVRGPRPSSAAAARSSAVSTSRRSVVSAARSRGTQPSATCRANDPTPKAEVHSTPARAVTSVDPVPSASATRARSTPDAARNAVARSWGAGREGRRGALRAASARRTCPPLPLSCLGRSLHPAHAHRLRERNADPQCRRRARAAPRRRSRHRPARPRSTPRPQRSCRARSPGRQRHAERR